MTLPRLRGRRPDRWSDMLRGAAVAVVLIGTVGSALAAKGWHETIARQRDDRLPDCHLEDAMEIADRLRTAQPEGTCSLGVAQWDGREDVAALVARADRALYAAKEAGRDHIHADAPTAVETAAP
jgi:GGDEF domain-containing protein